MGYSSSCDRTYKYGGFDNSMNSAETTPLKNGARRRSPFDDGDEVSHSTKDRVVAIVTIAASFMALILCGRILFTDAFGADPSQSIPKRSTPAEEISQQRLFDEYERYVLEDYDSRPPFSDFLPGIAGMYGEPMYAFYVNRGQGIASFGTESKDFAIMEFNSANKAYQLTPLLGFRTFIQGSRHGRSFLKEPFSPQTTRYQSDESSALPKRYMYVGTNEMQIREIDSSEEIETNVTYFVLAEEDFGALVRRTSITNTNQKHHLTLSLLDGLARMEPAGGKLDDMLKTMGRTLEAWMSVYQTYNDTISMPYYRISTEPSDTASVKVQEAGHYCLAMDESASMTFLPIIYDTSKVFGEDTTLLRPVQLESKSIGEIIAGNQFGSAKTSSAFAAVDKVVLAPGETLTINSFYGRADHILDVPVIARRVGQEGFVQYKARRGREIVEQITANVETKTGNALFDAHVQQVFLDSSLRGGIPIVLGDVDDAAKMCSSDEDERLKVYHIFSRIHGDLERDYNDFVIRSTYFSEGPGNFRDVAQNRRNDINLNPRVGAFNIKLFLSYIQADGYEPLTVESVTFTIRDLSLCEDIAARAVGRADGHRAQREALAGILNDGPFRPGELFSLMSQRHIELMITKQAFIDMVAATAEYHHMGVYETGFWADHWTAYLDLINSYLSIYPDREENLLFEKQLAYFFSPASVRPRKKKYVLSKSFDGRRAHVRQLNSTVLDEEKRRYMHQRVSSADNWKRLEASWQHDASGNVFKSAVVAKLLLLATLKFATRDAYGMGIEYEGGRPGWDDANNGLVGMLGSGMPETFELMELLRYLLSVVTKYQRPIAVPFELSELINKTNAELGKLMVNLNETTPASKVPIDFFAYWDSVSNAREEYREKIRVVFSGDTVDLPPHFVESSLKNWIDHVKLGIKRALAFGTRGHGDDGSSGVTPTYFSFNVSKWRKTGETDEEGRKLVNATELRVIRFPLFLEGPTRMMKTLDNDGARDVYTKVRSSALRDNELGMYALSASLQGQSLEIGRMMAFAPGWLENQSIWLHMSYKFYVELLRQGMFDEFFEEMQSGGLLPFMKPDKYGRSPMECSSFLPSSAFEDPSMRGRGFLARLTGATAEYLSMWILMMIGPNPFFVDEATRELRMQLLPALPLWLFDNDKVDDPSKSLQIYFKLFGSISVRYYNWRQTNLYRIPPSRYVVGLRDGSVFLEKGPYLSSALADKIRRIVFVDFIEAHFE